MRWGSECLCGGHARCLNSMSTAAGEKGRECYGARRELAPSRRQSSQFCHRGGAPVAGKIGVMGARRPAGWKSSASRNSFVVLPAFTELNLLAPRRGIRQQNMSGRLWRISRLMPRIERAIGMPNRRSSEAGRLAPIASWASTSLN